MTPKQSDSIRNKILKIKKLLAEDKKRWGGFYEDSRGLRYLPPKLYIQLEDYSEGLKYVKWFKKNFSDDAGYPEFLFEMTIILFKSRKFVEAEKMAFSTFCSNTYIFDKYFGKTIVPISKSENFNTEKPEFIETFEYSYEQTKLSDFSEWLKNLISTDKFINASSKYIEIQKRLMNEDDREMRHYLISQARQLETNY